MKIISFFYTMEVSVKNAAALTIIFKGVSYVYTNRDFPIVAVLKACKNVNRTKFEELMSQFNMYEKIDILLNYMIAYKAFHEYFFMKISELARLRPFPEFGLRLQEIEKNHASYKVYSDVKAKKEKAAKLIEPIKKTDAKSKLIAICLRHKRSDIAEIIDNNESFDPLYLQKIMPIEALPIDKLRAYLGIKIGTITMPTFEEEVNEPRLIYYYLYRNELGGEIDKILTVIAMDIFNAVPASIDEFETYVDKITDISQLELTMIITLGQLDSHGIYFQVPDSALKKIIQKLVKKFADFQSVLP